RRAIGGTRPRRQRRSIRHAGGRGQRQCRAGAWVGPARAAVVVCGAGRAVRPIRTVALKGLPPGSARLRLWGSTSPLLMPGEPPVPPSSCACTLLCGLRALQTDFLPGEKLLQGVNAWLLRKEEPLGDVLQQAGLIEPEEAVLIDVLVARHLFRHGGDGPK